MAHLPRPIAVALLGSALAAGCQSVPVFAGPMTWSFEEDAADRPAAGWVVPRVSYGGTDVPAGRWIVDRDPRAPSPAQLLRQVTTHFEGEHFNVIVADTPPVDDFRLLVQLRSYPGARAERIRQEYADSGLEVPADADLDEEDRGGGPVFRYTDVRNYYVIRWNPLEFTVNLYVVRKGKRSKLASARVATKADDTTWHQLEVACRGPRIVCAFDGEAVLDHADATHRRGRIGLWTKADSSAGFDDVRLELLGAEAGAGAR
jgi:hypothetical protein